MKNVYKYMLKKLVRILNMSNILLLQLKNSKIFCKKDSNINFSYSFDEINYIDYNTGETPIILVCKYINTLHPYFHMILNNSSLSILNMKDHSFKNCIDYLLVNNLYNMKYIRLLINKGIRIRRHQWKYTIINKIYNEYIKSRLLLKQFMIDNICVN